jgi:hypothetical protein
MELSETQLWESLKSQGISTDKMGVTTFELASAMFDEDNHLILLECTLNGNINCISPSGYPPQLGYTPHLSNFWLLFQRNCRR